MGRKVKVDLTGVESFQRANEGLHICKIVSAEMKQSSSGNEMIVVAFEVTKGDDKGSRVYENYPLVDNALWKLKGMLQAIGMKADGKVQLDLDKLIGKILQVNVKHEEYDGQIRARVESVMKLGSTAATSDDDDDEEDEIEPEDTEDEEEEEKPAKKTKATKKKAPMNPPADEDEDDDWDEDDGDDEEDEEPEEKPAKKSKKAAKGKTAAKAKSKKAESEDDDDDWDDDDDDWDDEN